MDTLEPALFDGLKAGLLSIYQASGESHPLRIAVFRNGAIELAGPFRTRAEFQTALRQIQPGGDPGVSVLSGPKFYTGLPAALKMAVAEGRGPWPSVLLATHFPDIDPALLEYGTASLAAPLLAQRLRVGYWNIGGNAVPLLDAVAKLTGGIGAAEPASWIDRTEQALHSFGELGWDEPGLSRGFHLYTAKLVNGSGTVVASMGRIAYPSGQPLPDPEQYAKLIQSVKSAADLLQRASLNTDETAQVRAHLETALSINSRDHTALRLAADFYKRYNDHKTAAGLLASLTEIDPRNGALWNELGHEYFIENNLEAAEQALGRGRQLKAVSAVAAAELARIHLARHDAAGALPLLDESLRLDAKNQELWFLRADTCRTLNDWKCEAESLDRGIALGGDQAGGDQAGGDQTAHHHPGTAVSGSRQRCPSKRTGGPHNQIAARGPGCAGNLGRFPGGIETPGRCVADVAADARARQEPGRCALCRSASAAGQGRSSPCSRSIGNGINRRSALRPAATGEGGRAGTAGQPLRRSRECPRRGGGHRRFGAVAA